MSDQVVSLRSLRAEPQLDEAAIRAIFDAVSNWGRWGPDDELGALNYITPALRREAAALVRSTSMSGPSPTTSRRARLDRVTSASTWRASRPPFSGTSRPTKPRVTSTSSARWVPGAYAHSSNPSDHIKLDTKPVVFTKDENGELRYAPMERKY